MTQTVQLDVLNSNTGVSFGSTVYQLDGTTQYSAFSTSGWSELPAGSGSWHNSALTLPDAGGVVAYGVSGNEYNRATFGPATLAASNYTTPPTVTAIRQEMDSNSTKLANLDATVSSRSTYSGGAVASVTGNVGGNVVGSVGSVTSGVTVTTNNDKTGYGLSSAAIQAIWDALTSALTTVGSIGKLLVTNIDAAISSRLPTSSYTAPTTPPTVTAIRQEMDTNSTKLANLDTTVGSRLATAGYTTPPTVAAIRSEIDNNSTTLSAIWTLENTIKTDIDDTRTQIGAGGVNLTALATQSSVDAIDTKLGNPDNATVSQDILQVYAHVSDTVSILNSLNNLSTTDIDNRLAAYDVATAGSVGDLSAKIGNPDGISVSADIAQLTTNLNDVANAIYALNNLSATDAAAAIMAYALAGGRSFQTAFTDLWAVMAGNSIADDATAPTFIQYANPNGDIQIGHVFTDTTRSID